MKRVLGLRVRLYLTILPLVVAMLTLSGVLSSLNARMALVRSANRHLAYKAEQLRDFFRSQWDVITKMELEDNPGFRAAAEASFRSFAESLLRSGTETVLAFDSRGSLVLRASLSAPEPPGLGAESVLLSPGWFSRPLFGEARVGVAFELEPFGWTVALTELESVYFSDMRNIRLFHVWTIILSVLVVTVILSLYVRRVARPIENLTGTVSGITSSLDLSRRAPGFYEDEIGILARSFNSMLETLQGNYEQLEAASRAETEARKSVVQREEETLYLLGRVSDFRDEQTGSHLRRIGELSELFARLAGLDEEARRSILFAAPLHDIGKIGIPDAILLKPGKLTPEEFETIKTHTLLGYELLKESRSAYLMEGARIALTHHEAWDGGGYPRGIRGTDIPMAGRIVSVVDVFDALVSDRPYKKAWEPDKALEFILEQGGKKFDPGLVDIFRNNFPEFLRLLG